MKPTVSTGMIGQSSTRGKWVSPKVCHTTMSVPSTERSWAVHSGRPPLPACWLGKSPVGYRSDSSYGVTHRALVANAARRWIEESSEASMVGSPSGCSL